MILKGNSRQPNTAGVALCVLALGLQSVCEKAGIIWGRDVKGGFIFHDLRHTFVTDMRKAGVSKSVRMSITGHSPKDMDDRYNRVDDEDKHEAVRQLEVFRASVRQNI